MSNGIERALFQRDSRDAISSDRTAKPQPPPPPKVAVVATMIDARAAGAGDPFDVRTQHLKNTPSFSCSCSENWRIMNCLFITAEG